MPHMDELVKIKHKLEELKKLMFWLNDLLDKLPPLMFCVSPYEVLDDLKSLCGFVDCMIHFNISLQTPLGKSPACMDIFHKH